MKKYGKIWKENALLEYKRIGPSMGNFEKTKKILLLLEVCIEWGKKQTFLCNLQVANAYLRQRIFDSHALQMLNLM